MNDTITIPALGDNYIYLYCYGQGRAIAVDPCEAEAVLGGLETRDLKLTAIFATHHHWDHTGGIKELQGITDCEIFGFDKSRIPEITTELKDGQIVKLGSEKLKAILTPGHTQDSVCFYLLPSEKHQSGILWTGDTLFVGGCGRIFGGTAEVMWTSLCKLKSLPADTLVYCGHNYATENFQFALSIEPDNKDLKQHSKQIQQLEKQGKLTVPSTIQQEKRMNPFFRASTAKLKEALNMNKNSDVEVFAELRRRKDIF